MTGPASGASILRDRSYVRYLTARTVSVAGSGLTMVALPLTAYLLSGSAAAVGLTIAFTYIPYIVVGPDRRRHCGPIRPAPDGHQ